MAYNQYGLTTTNATSLVNLLTNLGNTPATIWVKSAQTISSNLTIPATITLKFIRGGVLKPANGVTVVANCLWEAGPFQTIDLSLGGIISFTTNNQQQVYLFEWWGIDATGVADAQPLLTSAVAATPDGCTLRVVTQNTIWKLSSTWKISNKTGLVIETTSLIPGQTSTFYINWSGAAGGTMINFFCCGSCTFRGFNLTGNNADYCILVNGTSGLNGGTRISTQNDFSYNFIYNNVPRSTMTGIGLASDGSYSNNEFMYVHHNWFLSNGGYFNGVSEVNAGSGIAIKLGNQSNNHLHLFEFNTIQGWNKGISDEGGWSGYNAYRMDFINNNIDMFYTSAGVPTIVNYSDTEQSGQYLVYGGGGGQGSLTTLRFENCRIANFNNTASRPCIQFTGLGCGGAVEFNGIDFDGQYGANTKLFQIPYAVTPGPLTVSIKNITYDSVGGNIGTLLDRPAGSGGYHPTILFEHDFLQGTTVTQNPLSVFNPNFTAALTISANTLTFNDFLNFVNTGSLTTITQAYTSNHLNSGNLPTTLKIVAVGGAITVNTGGNIARAGSIPTGKLATFYYNPGDTLWYGDY